MRTKINQTNGIVVKQGFDANAAQALQPAKDVLDASPFNALDLCIQFFSFEQNASTTAESAVLHIETSMTNDEEAPFWTELASINLYTVFQTSTGPMAYTVSVNEKILNFVRWTLTMSTSSPATLSGVFQITGYGQS